MMLGQHRAWSDGSVEWVAGSEIDGDVTRRESTASYKIGPPGNWYSYAWF